MFLVGRPCGRKKTLFPNTRRPRIVPPYAALLAVIPLVVLPRLSMAQEKADTAMPPPAGSAAQEKPAGGPNPAGQPPAPTPDAGQNAKPNPQNAPSPADVPTPNNAPPSLPQFTIGGTYYSNPVTGDVRFEGRSSIAYQGITIAADRIEGNINTELVFSGNAVINAGGATTYADTIHFFPRTRRYRLDNARTILTPEMLQNRAYDNVYVTARDVLGTRTGYTLGEGTTETTCIEPFHHYELRSRAAQIFPGKRLVLHQTSVFLFGAKLITLPYLVIPLDQKPRKRARTDYLPEFGQNYDEGYYARFPYEFPIGADAATYAQVSVTQRRGERIRLEQEYLAGKQDNAYNTSGFGFGGGYTGGSSFGSGFAAAATRAGRSTPRSGTAISGRTCRVWAWGLARPAGDCSPFRAIPLMASIRISPRVFDISRASGAATASASARNSTSRVLLSRPGRPVRTPGLTLPTTIRCMASTASPP